MTTDPTAWSRRRFLGATVTASGLAIAGLAGCSLGPASSSDPSVDTGESKAWGGEVDEQGLAKPDVTFTDMNGEPFPFVEKTKGKLALLFFGYTNCPDVCPVTLSSLARALDQIGSGPGSDPMVLFVGVDVARDTPEQLQTYLGRINPTFLGLTGDESDVIAEANRQVFNPPIVIEEPDADGEYAVGHSKKVLAYSPTDDLAHRYYDGDRVRPQTWVNDLPRLAEGEYQ
ncbi:MAG TPA: SCO family protein [Acidimicrobiales bacterium]|jgi:protein SCO1/2|nr:SCO family protein [Acidimicrobiales bacterium]